MLHTILTKKVKFRYSEKARIFLEKVSHFVLTLKFNFCKNKLEICSVEHIPSSKNDWLCYYPAKMGD